MKRWVSFLVPCLLVLFLAPSAPHLLCAQGAPTRLPPIRISYGQTLNGVLLYSPIDPCSGGVYDATYQFDGTAGDYITITVQFSASYQPTEHHGFPQVYVHTPGNGETFSSSQDDPHKLALTNQRLPTTATYLVDIQVESDIFQNAPGVLKIPFTITLLKTTAPTATVPPPTGTPVPTNTAMPTITSWPTVGHTFAVGRSPSYAIWHNNQLYVANFNDGTVSVLDAQGKSIATINVGGAPYGMAWEGSTNRLWVADFGTAAKPGNSITIADFSSGANGKTQSIKVGARPLSLSYDNGMMWVALYADRKIVGIDPSGKIVTTLAVPGNPNTVLGTPSGLYFTLGGDYNNIFHITPGTSTSTQRPNPIRVGNGPTDLAWDETAQRLFVANYNDNTVSVVDAHDDSVLGTYPVGKGPTALAWDGKRLWIALYDEKALSAMAPDGTTIFKMSTVSEPNSVAWNGSDEIAVVDRGTTARPDNRVTLLPFAEIVPPLPNS